MNSTEGGHSGRALPKGSVLVLPNMSPSHMLKSMCLPFKSPVPLALAPTPACTGTIEHLEMLEASKKAASNPEKSVLQQRETKIEENVN